MCFCGFFSIFEIICVLAEVLPEAQLLQRFWYVSYSESGTYILIEKMFWLQFDECKM